MPEDRTILTADASQYFDVLRRAGTAADRLGASGARVGEGFVRGERAIRVASQNISSALLTAGDATSTFLIAASGLERVFKLGIGPTIGVAALIKGFEVMHEQVKKTNDAYDDLKKEIEKPIRVDPVTSEMDKRIDDLTEKIKKLNEEANKPLSKTSGLFAVLAAMTGSLVLPEVLKGPALSGLKGLVPVGGAKLAELSKAGIDKIDALAAERGRKILEAADKLHDALREAVQRFRNSTANLFRDIGSGQFLKDQQQRQLENNQTSAGQEMVRQFEQDIANGVLLGPNAQAMVEAARAAAAKGGVGIDDILNADFSNLDMLSKYDFSGLQPLSGLTIIIQ